MKYVKAAKARHLKGEGATADVEKAQDYCPAPKASAGARTEKPATLGTSRVSKGEKIASIGSIASAVVASACCWLPVLLLAVGVSGAAVGAAFERYRLILLGVSFALLGAAFYFAYRHRPKMALSIVAGKENDSCCPSERESRSPIIIQKWTAQRLNRSMLWLVTLIVLASAFFPNYVGLLSSNTGLRNTPVTREGLDTVVIAIEGMTCKACAKTLQRQLATVSGVSAAEVSYEKRLAVVGVPKGRPVPVANLLAKIKDAGYGGTLVDLRK